MSLIATALKHMLASGMAHDAIVAAIEEMEACLPTEKPRSSAADRMARMRERNKASQSVTCVTCVTERNEDEAKKEIPPTPPKEKNIYITPESSNELSAPKRSRRKPETPLPVDFPTAEQISEAETRADSAGVKLNIKHQANQFRANAQTNDRRCRDWSAAWRMWVGKAIEWAGGRADGEPPPQAPPRADLIRAYRHSGTWPSEWGERPTPEELAA
jgi:hypothetical protein